MRRPPHLPFLDGAASLSPGLRPIPSEHLIDPDSEAAVWLPEKRRIMRERRDDVFASRLAEAALAEAAARATAHLPPSDESWPTSLEAAAARVSDDLCLLERGGDGLWRLEAASLVAPTFWLLSEKVGQPLGGLHGPVPGANPALVVRIARMFDAIRPGQVLERFNWTVQAGDARFTPSSAPLKALAAETADADALDVLHLRVERQTISKLPESGLLLFTIRIVVDPLRAALDTPHHVAAFRQAWEGTGRDLADYKGWPHYDRLVRAALQRLS
ncbi:MAG: DUF3445 domain-containing protein [Hyphomonas sp.]|nr:DUF3445 domain-containing protein [Hyphomonas sp.]MCB9970290.1 DUF3445 domain-containing protein [Hyphomonas sp.]